MTRRLLAATLLALAAGAGVAVAGPQQQALLDGYAREAGTAPSAERGRAFFFATHTGGKPETPSCITCHGKDLTRAGRTRAGKTIEPMAVSANPKRFTDRAEVEKWFGRNCHTVLGRTCTAGEKADVVAFLTSL